ncbi:MAG TPA: helicase C-terminal domain-containing protein, partial [Ardenticatenaceae bacterium]|nr:helicase C-terminal domain-containing protein [Ardenticatenaceae bacterium]
IIVAPESEDICWISRHPVRGEFRLHHAPLHPARQLAETLFQPKRSVILTSATLQIESSFEYVRERLGLAVRYRELAVGSPFDYRRAALVYVTTDLPEPNSPNYAQTLHRAVIDLARATRGRMLVLLTSKSQLRAAYRAISDPLANDGIVVLGQYMDGGRRQLLERFKTIERCVLLGTQSFWEGVDVPGPALSCLVIARLPFPVPSDPIFSARSESYDDPFFQYAVPQTVIRFRQGFGRLIRSREDRGLVALLDSRVSTKSYGSIFLNSLPAADIRFGLCRDLPPLAERWLAEE